jgi:hypothetical protein
MVAMSWPRATTVENESAKFRTPGYSGSDRSFVDRVQKMGLKMREVQYLDLSAEHLYLNMTKHDITFNFLKA